MTLEEKISALISFRNINKRILSKETNIPYTTIDSFLKRQTNDIKMSVLVPISRYFKVPLEFFYDEEINENNFNTYYFKYQFNYANNNEYIANNKYDKERVSLQNNAYKLISELEINQLEVVVNLLKLILGEE